MTVAVGSQGSFEQDVALARSLDGVVVLQARKQECNVLYADGDGTLGYELLQDVKTYFEETGAGGTPWFCFHGVAYAKDSGPITKFGPEEIREAQEFYDSLVGSHETAEV